MASDPTLPYLPRPGDVVVALPHTLTRATRDGLDAAARAVLPSAASLSRHAPDPRLVLDARDCAVIDGDGVATLVGLVRAAAASGAGAVLVDAAPDVARLLARSPAARGITLVFATRPAAALPEAPTTHEPAAGADARTAGEVRVLPLDESARERMRRRRL